MDANFTKLAEELNCFLSHSWREYFMRCGQYESMSVVYAKNPGQEIKELLTLLLAKGSLPVFRKLLEEKEEAMSMAAINASQVKNLFYV